MCVHAVQAVRQAYHDTFGRDLLQDVKGETSGDMQGLLLGLLLTSAE